MDQVRNYSFDRPEIPIDNELSFQEEEDCGHQSNAPDEKRIILEEMVVPWSEY